MVLPHPIPNLAFAATVTAGQLRSWLRSVLLFQAFGSDALTSVTQVRGQENEMNGADHNHDAPFAAGLHRLRTANVPRWNQFTDAAALKYFMALSVYSEEWARPTPSIGQLHRVHG